MIERRSRRWLLAALAVVVVATAGTGCRRERNFTITFEDANGLRPGQFLSYKGMRAGEVTAVALGADRRIHVEAKLYPEFRDQVSRTAVFRIENPRGWLDLSGERQVTVTDSVGTPEPIRSGDVLRGSGGVLGDVLAGAKSAVSAAIGIVKNLGASPEAQAIQRSMEDFAAQGHRLAGEQYESFKRDQLPALREQAERYRRQLEKDGNMAKAREFWNSFTAWAREMEKAGK